MKRKVLVGLTITALLLVLSVSLLTLFVDDASASHPPIPTRRPKWPPGQPTSTSTVASTPTSTPVEPTVTPEPVCEYTIPNGIMENTTWQANCIYIANDGIYVAPGAVLTVPEGVTILIGSWKGIDVRGSLLVHGAMDNPVVIRRLFEDLSWTGIHIQSVSMPASDLTYLSIEGSYAGIRVVSGEVWITNCAIEGWRKAGDR